VELKLTKILKNVHSIAIDTAPFIYYIEENEKYINALDQLFTLLSEGKISAFTSYITLIEVLTKPIEQEDNDLIEKYENLLANSENLVLYEVNRQVAVKSAKLRASYSLKTPDAIQLSVAIINGATHFITNDVNLKKVKEIKVIVLDEIIKYTDKNF